MWLGGQLGREDADRLIVAAAFVVAMLTWTREPLAHALFRSHLRGGGRWPVAMPSWPPATTGCPGSCAVGSPELASSSGSGLPAGGQVPDLETQAERIAAFLAVREVRVIRDPASARYARVVVLRRDPLADPAPTPWPLVNADRCRCGSRSRSGRTRTATRSPSPCPSATCSWAGSPAPASPTCSSS